MNPTRPAIERISLIHEELRADTFPNCRKIAEKIEVSAKTIQRDIDFMRDRLGLPIEYHPTKFGFYYTKAIVRPPFSWSSMFSAIRKVLQ